MFTLLLGASLSVAQSGAPKVRLDPQSVQASSTALYASIEEAVRAAGGLPDSEQLNLAVAFSTGHFASDPGMAEAARAISTALVDQHLVQGDTVRAYAWEMNVWPHAGAELNPFKVPGSPPGTAGKADVNRLWPRSTQPGSAGGHDTEQAAVTIAADLPDPAGTVIVLLTNTAYSVASNTQKPVGDSNEAYRTLLESFTRLPAKNSSGASVPLKFKELTSGRERNLDAVVLVPAAYRAAALGEQTRTQLLSGPVRAPGRPWWWIPAGVVVLGGLAFVVFRVIGGGTPRPKSASAPKGAAGPLALDIEGQVIALPKAGDPPLVARVVRSGQTPGDRTVVLPETRLPVTLATLELVKGGLEIKCEKDVKLTSINGQPPSRPVLPLQAGTYRMEFKGHYREKESLPPKPFTHTVRVRLSPVTPLVPSPRPAGAQ